jgi:hypothetical protein
MKSVRDCFGRSVRLTEERMAHILQHQEMAGMEAEIEGVLQSPAEVRVSRSDDRVQCFMSSMRRRVSVGNGCVSW